MVNTYESKQRIIMGDWREQSTKDTSFRKGRISILSEPFVITLKCLIADKGKRPMLIYGTASSITGGREGLKEAVPKAYFNALMVYYKRYGTTSPDVQILGYKINYFDEITSIKRISIKGKYYMQLRDRRTGNIISTERWSSKSVGIEDFLP